MTVFGMSVASSLSISLCKCTVSKAFDMSRATATVCCGGCRLLKPVVIMLFMLCRAVVVECLVRNPCWCGGEVTLSVMCGRIIFSSVFAIGESSAIGLYDVPIVGSLLGLSMGIVLAVFQRCGMLLLVCVERYVIDVCE